MDVFCISQILGMTEFRCVGDIGMTDSLCSIIVMTLSFDLYQLAIQ